MARLVLLAGIAEEAAICNPHLLQQAHRVRPVSLRSGRLPRPGHRPSSPGTGSHRQRQRSEEHTSELQSLMRISYAVFCLKKKTIQSKNSTTSTQAETYLHYAT